MNPAAQISRDVPAAGLSRTEWRVLVLLVISIFINYIDRANLAIAAPLIQGELHIGPESLGALLAAFSFTYAGFQLFGIAGWLVDRYNPALVYAAAFVVWTAATAATGFTTTFAAMFAMRLVLGAGESVAYPCYSKIFARHYLEHHRGTANAMLDAGSKLGPGLGTLLGGLLVATFGWRIFFIVLGLGSLLWVMPWMAWRPRGSGHIETVGPTPPVRAILRQRSAWGTFFGLFCANYFWFFLLNWLPTYLVRERHYSIEQMAQVGSLAYFAIAATSVLSGWLSDRWIRAGGSVTRVRKTFTVSGLALSTIILPVAIIEDTTAAVGLLLLSCLAFGIFCSNHWAITQTLAGPSAAGRWTSLQNGVGNLAGITAPWLTGVLVERTGSFHLAFVAAAVIVLAGAVMYGFVIGRVEPARFAEPVR